MGRLSDLRWEAGRGHGLVAGGRAGCESLRLEKGYRLWGADMHTEYGLYEAGVGFAVKLANGEFVGREALLRAKERGPRRRLCCLTLDDPDAIVMGKEPILVGDHVAGYVTSAACGYSVRRSIAYGYLPIEHATEGTNVEIEYFGVRYPATVTREPLFDPDGARLRL